MNDKIMEKLEALERRLDIIEGELRIIAAQSDACFIMTEALMLINPDRRTLLKDTFLEEMEELKKAYRETAMEIPFPDWLQDHCEIIDKVTKNWPYLLDT